MKFFCISDRFTHQIFPNSTLDLLQKACTNRDIEFIHLEPRQFDFTQPPILNPGDALYRSSMSPLARAVERFLIRDDLATFYPTVNRALCDYDDLSFHRLEGVPTPKTILGVANNYTLLKKYSEYLGGFPIVLKVLGKSSGAGVIKVDSLDGLSSVVRLVSSDPQAKFVLKSFIKTTFSVRAIVLGGEVIDAISYRSRRGDFRTNVQKDPIMQPYTLSPELKLISINAVRSLGVEFGGVDILIDDAGKAYVAEVNFPCVFPDVELTTGTNVAQLMVDYLQEKSKQTN